MAIKINVHSLAAKDAVSLQLFDYVYAWLQSREVANNYHTDTVIEFSDGIKDGYLNILFVSMPKEPLVNPESYDLILLDNADECLEVSTPVIYETLRKYKHAYLIADSYLTEDHPLVDRVIPTIFDFWKFRLYNLLPQYPQYYELENRDNDRKPITFINGNNRVPRWHFKETLTRYLPAVTVRSKMTLDNKIIEIGESFFESPEDTEFRTWLNSYYKVSSLEDGTLAYVYHDRSPEIGIDKKLGKIPPGYFLFDAYFDYNVIIYPESSWINNQLTITEKATKCFYSRAFPAPVSGSKVNQLYNKLGFYTAWNLLPPEHQEFDNNHNHRERYNQMAQAMKWLHDNPEVFKMQKALDMLESNFVHALTWKSAMPGVEAFWKILQSKIK